MMGFGGGGAVTWIKVVVAVLVIVEYGGSGAWGQNSQQGWLNIDCGAEVDYKDGGTGINWVSDAPYITNGKVGTITGYSSFPEAKTLRYFDQPQGKNCYKLPVISNGVYMLRATFFYAAYDNAPNPPTFQLAIDGTVYDTFTADATIGQWREVFFVAQSNVTFFCLVRDPTFNSVPFISAITLKPYTGKYLGFNAYFADKRLIRTVQRVNFGGNNLIRYPDDPFDRYWFGQGTNTSYLQTATPLKVLNTTLPIVNTEKNAFYVPWPVLQDGLQLPAPGNMTLLANGGTEGDSDVYSLAEICLHFAELDETANITSRGFDITVPRPGGPQVFYENAFNYTDNFTKIPMPFTANTWYFWDLIDFGPSSAITFSPSPNAVRGPIINGMELFAITEPADLTLTTSGNALALEAIKVDMKLTAWTGDPCVPVPHNWVNCTLNTKTQQLEVTVVDLSGYNLSGTISPSFAKLDGLISLSLANNALTGPLPDLSTITTLKSLRLENNALTGPLPNWLTSLKSLTKLSVQNNNFSGEIPSGLLAANYLQFTYQPGNPDLIGGTSKPSSSKSSSKVGIIVGAIVGGLVGLGALVALVVCCCMCISRANARKTAKSQGVSLSEIAGAKAFSFAQIAAFTNNFKRKIGSGGFGPVYYGRLPGGQEVAVKVADSSSHQGAAEFHNEVELMSRVHHRNLVPFVGYCQEGANQILVYEFIDLGSLQDNLFGTSSRNAEAFNWNRRLNIAVNAAQGLEYLHTGCVPGIIHRDVKSSNILLTSKPEVAKVADFGLSKLTSDENATHVSTLVKGTAGYLDPEYFQTNFLTFKSDIYSFGVVLLELMTGQPPINTSPSSRCAGSLVEWVRQNLSAGDIDKILDPTVKASKPNMDGLWKVAEVAMICVEPKGVHRPTMSEVVQELRAALALEVGSTEDNPSEVSSNDVSAIFSGSMPTGR
ncbi:hypothetical protein M758_6G194000 [Ceratodon purpureus]|nr:hypothetical protein M758_6G194000 [Ceratodon purpureus]